MDPFRLYNGLDESYVPIEAEARAGGPVLPPYPSRVRLFMYACAQVAENERHPKEQARARPGR